MLALLQFIEQSSVPLTPAEIADQAVLGWLESRCHEAEHVPRPILRGYQWKCLFLPEGTQLRVWCRHEHGYAEVIGDELIYNDRSVSPNQFVAACADTVRNAWVEINMLMPGETKWKLASVRRREIETAAKLAKAAPGNPAIPANPANPANPAPAQPQGHGAQRSGAAMLEDDELELSVDPTYQAGRRGKREERRDPRGPLDRRD